MTFGIILDSASINQNKNFTNEVGLNNAVIVINTVIDKSRFETEEREKAVSVSRKDESE